MRKRFGCVVGLLILVWACDRCETKPKAVQAPKKAPAAPAEEPVKALRRLAKLDMPRVLLGRRLYHDKALSGDGTIACVTCHSLDHGGAEPRPVSVGIGGQKGPINSPTVLNAVYNFRQFWDGRAADLVEQAAGPVENPIEMGHSFPAIEKAFAANASYAKAFQEVYKDAPKKAHIVDAIAAYEAALITPSPFDAYLDGQQNAISEDAKAGYAAFKEVGCTACHNGVLLGGQMYQKMGLVKDYFAARGTPITEADLGRYNVTKEEGDKHRFKVPTLRNVALTPPYLHDGSQESLEAVIALMATYQLGKTLTPEQVAKIKVFLESLNGTLPDYARPPVAAVASAAL